MQRILLIIATFLGFFPLSSYAQNLRIVSAQLTSGNFSDYNSGHGIRVLQGIKADIVLIQQFNYTAGTYASFATTTLGPGTVYYRGTGEIPTGILSRYPIVDAGEWTDPEIANRAFSWAKIGLPGGKFLWAVSVQLSTNASDRDVSATALVSRIQANIPASDYLVIGGNFNCNTRTEALFTTLGSVVTVPANFPVDQAGNSNTNSPRTRPYDNILFNAGLQAIATPTVVGNNSFPAGLVFDTRVYTPLADFAPAQVTDSTALNRMAVLRDVNLGSTIRILSSSFSPAPSASGNITFTSQTGVTYSVQASSTLLADSWQGIGNITAPAGASTSVQIVPSSPGPAQVADPQLGVAPKRFYRIQR